MGETGSQSQPIQRCRCCDVAIDSRPFEVVSWRDKSSHRYGVCPSCESINLHGYTDPSSYYGEDYEPARRPEPRASTLLLQAAGMSAAWAVSGRPGPWLYRLGDWILPTWTGWFAGFGVRRSSHILDVGSGRGALLLHLRRWGFRSLTGIDPYLTEREALQRPGIRLERVDLEAYATQHEVDAVIFNHSLEHVDDPAALLRLAAPMVSGGGPVVVILPMAGGRVWERYRDMWSAIDAPLHRFLPSPLGMERLAKRCGLRVVRMRGQTSAAHYLASEAIRRCHAPGEARDVLSDAEQKWFSRLARREKGTMAAEGSFVLERPTRSSVERSAGLAATVP